MKKAFVQAVKADADTYVQKLITCMTQIADGSMNNGTLVSATKFTQFQIGEDSNLYESVGPLVDHFGSELLHPLLEDPEHASVEEEDVEKFLWHPSERDLRHHSISRFEGGALTQFNITCGDSEPFLTMKTLVGTFMQDDMRAYTGVFLLLKFPSDSVEIVAGTRGNSNPVNFYVSSVPDNLATLVHEAKHRIQECVLNKTFSIHGVVGGGWREFHQTNDNEEDSDDDSTQPALFGYMETFKISYSSSKTSIAMNLTNQSKVLPAGFAAEIPDANHVIMSAITAAADCNDPSPLKACFFPKNMESLGFTQSFQSKTLEKEPYRAGAMMYGVIFSLLIVIAAVTYRSLRRRTGYQSIPPVSN
nr:AlNc14C430G11587 [Albugo laibachii Nc14]|eukprot:CCA26920.1 AlNc14C430G11587 [Albugo laibachii Nc14]